MSATRTGTSSVVVAGSYFHTGRSGATLASADSITITDSFHEVSGSTTINTINGGEAGMGIFLYRPVGATWALGSSGNIKASSSSPTDRVVFLVTPDGTTWYGDSQGVSVASANTDITVSESGGTYTLTFNPANVTLDEFAGPLAITKGGTGQATATAAFDALAPTTTQGDQLYHNGTDNVRLPKGTAGQLLTMNAGATAPEWATAAAQIPSVDSTAIVKGSADATKLLRFEVDGFTTGTTRVLTPPNANGTIAVLGTAQSFTAAQTFSAGVVLGGTTVTKVLSGTKASHDFGTIAFGSVATTTLTVTGAGTNDVVAVSPNIGNPAHILVTGYVSAANTVTLVARNVDASSAQAAGAQNYNVFVFSVS